MLARLTPEQFCYTHQPLFESSLGKHLRHILDHYLSFKRDYASGLIDYDQRLRDSELETNLDHAQAVIAQIIDFLEGLTIARAEQPLEVLMCSDVALPTGSITVSSLGRELQFLHGHCVHHYALMAALLRLQGIEIDNAFGVAPSTLIYQQNNAHVSLKESA